MAEPEYIIRDFKGYSIGYEYDEKSDTYEWFTTEPAKGDKQPFRVTFEGEWAAQAARVRFLDNISSLFNSYFKMRFAELGIDPATGRREVRRDNKNE